MDGEEGEGLRLSKRFSDKTAPGEVDNKTKSGTAWSHSYLNQKPWHPLSYPNQRRKWIAEQTNAQRQRRTEEVSREYAQEQEFFRQTALVSKKEKEKMEIMKAVSFMYVRPPGYNAESAKAAETADESKIQESNNPSSDHAAVGTSVERAPESSAVRDHVGDEKKKPRPKDVFGRHLPTEEEFEILKNAPRMETGAPARVKPFGVEVRNVKCLRCGNYGHQSGDRECPLKDAIMPNEQSRLKRDDPLTAIIAHTDPTEPLKWELKQKPGISPPRGGFEPDDPNQQIVAEDIFDEYGGFLGGDSIPKLLTNFSSRPKRTKSSSRKNEKKLLHASPTSRKSKYSKDNESVSPSYKERKPRSKKQHKMKRRNHSLSSALDESDFDGYNRGRRKHSSRAKQRGNNSSHSSEDWDSDAYEQSRNRRLKQSYSSKGLESDQCHKTKKKRRECSYSSEDSETERHRRRNKEDTHEKKDSRRLMSSYSSKGLESDQCHKMKKKSIECSYSSEDSETGRYCKRNKEDMHEENSSRRLKSSYLSRGLESDQYHKMEKKGKECSYSSEAFETEKHCKRSKKDMHEQSGSQRVKPSYSSKGLESEMKKKGRECSYSSEDSETERHYKKNKEDMHEQNNSQRLKSSYSSKGPESDQCHKTKKKGGECSYSSEDSATKRHLRRNNDKFKRFVSSEPNRGDSHRESERRGKTYYSSENLDHHREHKSRY